MKSLALNVLGNRSDAEDAVQETFLRAYKNRHSFRSDAALWTWVYRILLNACHDIGRSRAARRDNQMVDADVAVDLPTPAGDSPMRLTLQRAVARWNSSEMYGLVDGTWRIVHSHWSFIKPELKQAVTEISN